MNKREFFTMTLLSTLLSLAAVAAITLGFSPARAAPDGAGAAQTNRAGVQYVSVSAMAFLPAQQNSSFAKDPQRQLLYLMGNNRSFTLDRNVFVAPLLLPDGGQLLTMTVTGEDYDNQGEVRVRLKRCTQNQPVCVTLGETSSGGGFTGGYFESSPVFLQNERLNNGFYSYFLEMELTALNNSGLRSVRLEMVGSGDSSGPISSEVRWELAGSFTRFPIPNSGWAEVKICADDLSRLPNASHYPYVVVDGTNRALASNACLTVQGRDIEIRRNLNTGPSSGTYQILR